METSNKQYLPSLRLFLYIVLLITILLFLQGCRRVEEPLDTPDTSPVATSTSPPSATVVTRDRTPTQTSVIPPNLTSTQQTTPYPSFPTALPPSTSRIPFSNYLTLMNIASYRKNLNSIDGYTLLVPHNSAFEDLPTGVLESWLSDPPYLYSLLDHHTLEGKIRRTDLANLESITDIQGRNLIITSKSPLSINDVQVLSTDIIHGDIIIHVISDFLVPPE